MREIITFDTESEWLELRKQDITSTKVSALFNMSPYMTYYSLYHTMKGTYEPEFQENEYTKWGRRLEKTIAEGIAEDNKWIVRSLDEYYRLPELRMGSSFDFQIIIPERALLEIKNMDSFHFKNSWLIEDGEVKSAPYHIELQCQHQMMVSGFETLYIGALIGGNKVAILKRTATPAIFKKIEEKVEEFWHRFETNDAPPPDFNQDYETINAIYSSVSEGKIEDRHKDEELAALVKAYQDYGKTAKDIIDMQRACKADIIQRLGDAEKAIGDGFSISRKMIVKKPYQVEPKPYRDFRISAIKQKEE